MKIEYSNMWAGFEPPKVIFNELLKPFENTDKQFNISAVFGSVAKALKPGKIKHIDENIIGGINYFGKRNNKHEELNAIFDVGDKIIHFASVGSGQNFNNMLQNKKKINVPMSYIKFALERFDIYSQLFFNKKVINSDKNDLLVDKLKKLIFV